MILSQPTGNEGSKMKALLAIVTKVVCNVGRVN